MDLTSTSSIDGIDTNRARTSMAVLGGQPYMWVDEPGKKIRLLNLEASQRLVGVEASPYIITDPDGEVLARFATEQERDEALLTGEYPDDAEPAYENEA